MEFKKKYYNMNNKRCKFLFRFLKEHNCYNEFINNSNDNNISYFNSVRELLKYTDIHQCNELSNAFTWRDSHQGFEYWNELNNEWIVILRIYFPETKHYS